MIFPFCGRKNELEYADFDHFGADFSQTVLHFIPCAGGPVNFLPVVEGIEEWKKTTLRSSSWEEGVRKVKRLKQPIIIPDESVLFLPIWKGPDLFGVAVLEGVEAKLVNTLSGEWLSDRSRIISREFDLIKQLAIDPFTGLLNGRHLRYELDRILAEKTPFILALFEVYPKAKTAEKAQKSISRACYCLSSYFGQLPIHYLGLGVFALVWPHVDHEQSQKLGKSILNLFKREKFSQAHLGMTSVNINHSVDNSNEEIEAFTPEKVLDKAWQALGTACRRGPYALSSFNFIGNPENHPLAKLSPSVLSRFRRLWRGKENFAVILLQQDEGLQKSGFSKRIFTLLEAEAKLVVNNEKELYILLLGADEKKALAWAHSLSEKLAGMEGVTFSMGIATFPGYGFTKTDVPMNARKALLHTKFYGPGTVTPFDAVSLNISGDIYYNEGDLNRAVKEYRLGLALEPNNINLMNSLGEAFAQMNRHKMAVHFFEKVLEVDSVNYMALFNLGVARLMFGEDERAVDCFEKALATMIDDPQNILQPNVIQCEEHFELLLQLSRLYCKADRYKETINLLSACAGINNGAGMAETIEKRSVSHGGVFRYLGKAFKELGKNQEAITFLQRAIRHNPRDAPSLSLLGELYCLEKQGDEIALSLCRQAVDLDDSRWQHWYRLGWLHFRFGDYKESQPLLQECLLRNRKCIQVICLLGRVYEKLGMKRQAIKMYKKVMRLEPSHKTAKSALAELQLNK